MRFIVPIVLFVMLLATMPAEAKTWVIDYDKSYLGFVAQQSTQTIKGRFRKFSAQIDLDLAKPNQGKIIASIDMASVLGDTADVNANLPQSDWFNIAKFPQAELATTFIEADKPSCYKAEASLTIKGIAKDVTLPFCLTQEDGLTHAKGEVTLLRNDYGVGLGQWADESLVANPVKVVFDIAAK